MSSPQTTLQKRLFDADAEENAATNTPSTAINAKSATATTLKPTTPKTPTTSNTPASIDIIPPLLKAKPLKISKYAIALPKDSQPPEETDTLTTKRKRKQLVDYRVDLDLSENDFRERLPSKKEVSGKEGKQTKTSMKQKRIPIEGDEILISWVGEDKEYRVIVGKGGGKNAKGFIVKSADGTWKGTQAFDANVDSWRYEEKQSGGDNYGSVSSNKVPMPPTVIKKKAAMSFASANKAIIDGQEANFESQPQPPPVNKKPKKTSKSVTPPEEEYEQDPNSYSELSKLSNKQLEDKLIFMSLPKSGTKSTKINRIINDLRRKEEEENFAGEMVVMGAVDMTMNSLKEEKNVVML